MEDYAKYIDEYTVQYPTDAEFRAVINWRKHDAALRRHHYAPLVGEPEDREGFTARPLRFSLVEATRTVIEPRNADPVTGELFMEDIYEEDPETHEMVKVGERNVTRDVEVTYDDSHIDILEWDYMPIPVPEPPDTTERDAAEKAIVGGIAAMALKYDAMPDLYGMQDITIPNLRTLALERGVPDEEFGALITSLTPYKWQLEAVTGLLWADCWEGLKSRFAQWLEQIDSADE